MPKRPRGFTQTKSASAKKRFRATGVMTTPSRRGYSSVARTRGAAVTGEMKYFDCELTGTAITAVTTTWPNGTMMDPTTTINIGDAAVATPLALCVPKVSSALNGRQGRDINMMGVKVTGMINVPTQASQTGADLSCKIRLALVMDTQTNSAQMTAAQLYNDAGAASTTIHSFQNPNNFGRFRVLKEKVFTISDLNMVGSPTAADVAQTGKVIPFKFNHKFKKPVKVRFNATNGGTVADIIDNSLHIVAGANNVSYVPALSYYSRVAYKE